MLCLCFAGVCGCLMFGLLVIVCLVTYVWWLMLICVLWGGVASACQLSGFRVGIVVWVLCLLLWFNSVDMDLFK